MRTGLLLLLAIFAASLIAIWMQPAGAHNWVPQYDGAAWGRQCLASAGSRTSPATCCDHARFYCVAACGLANVDDGWKNACRANCQSAGAACLQRVQKRPLPGVVPGTRPPATTD